MNKITERIAGTGEIQGITLIVTQDRAREQVTELIASLAVSGPLFSISAGEWFPSFILSRTIRRRGGNAGEIAGRLRLARTSTCHRLLDTLSNLPSGGETILVIDFLDNFYNPDVPLSTRFFELRQCCRHLKQSAFFNPVVIVTQEIPTEDYKRFSPILRGIADRAVCLERETGPGPDTQPTLL